MPAFIHLVDDRVYYGLPLADPLPIEPSEPGLKVARHHGGLLTTADALDRIVHERDVEDVRSYLRAHLSNGDGPLLFSRVCMYTNTPDHHFIVGAHPRWPGCPRSLRPPDRPWRSSGGPSVRSPRACDSCAPDSCTDGGAAYDPKLDRWRPIAKDGAPMAYGANAVAAGGTMLVCGGVDTVEGGRYDPLKDEWARTTTVNAPDSRTDHLLAWTGSEMIVWGGHLVEAESTTNTGSSPTAPRQGRNPPHGGTGGRPPPRDRRGPVVPAQPVAATTLARVIPDAEVTAPNILSAKHLSRIAGGLLYAATSNLPWATLLARTFDVDVKACARCGGRLEVRAVVTDHDIARQILDAMPSTARAPPSLESTLVDETASA